MRVLSPRAIRAWSRVHTWTSLACTAFLLMLCLTGLPLIFSHEIDAAIGPTVTARAEPTARLDADRLLEIARGRVPGAIVQLILSGGDAAPLWRFAFAPSAQAREASAIVTIDARSGEVLRVGETYGGAFTDFMLRLHAELLLGEVGALALSGIGVLFLASIVSGVVVYAPFMRRLSFGSVRVAQGARLRWLDIHNLTGIALTLWLVVVGATGVVNTLAEQIFDHWQATELAEMIGAQPGRATMLLAPAHMVGPQRALDSALSVAPGMKPSWIAMPGNRLAGPRHYAVFLRGTTPLGTQLYKPVLIDAETGTVTAMRDLPWYGTLLALSHPLHFGDYGGLPLKIAWAMLDLFAIVVLASGLRLWLPPRGARGRPVAAE